MIKMSVDPYARPRHEGNTRRVKQHLLIDKTDNRFINAELLDLFKFASFGYGDQLNHVNTIDASVTLTVDDITGRVTGLAEMVGTYTVSSGSSNFQVRANFLNSQLNGDCTFFMQYDDANIYLDQAYFMDGECIVSLNLSYDYAMLKFNKYSYLSLKTWEPAEVWYEFNEHNIFLSVPKLLNLYPDLLSTDWEEKVLAAKNLFNEFSLG